MPIDTDRCHFCRNWTNDYKRVGDRAICEKCMNKLARLIKEELEL
ncbi:MAG: hypothetical protein ACOC53_07605 [Candidatus Saliniplasma sp.]